MAYELRSEKGVRICKNGEPIIAADTLEVKIEQLDDKNKSFVAVASTEHEDRDKDIVRQEGWKLANFKKNPIVPWSHNYYGVPVARSMKTWLDRDSANGPRLLFMPKFDADDDDSMKIYNKYKNGFLTSFSVGFRGIKFNFRDEEDRWWGGREFLQQELLEISAVSIPANPHANTRLNIAGEKEAENLVQLGYPEMFAKTESGLFYPVMEMAMFTQPKEFAVDKGVIAIRAMPLDSEIEVKNPVAYFFDPELFDDVSANAWIDENVDNCQQIKYYNIGVGENGMFSLEGVFDVSDIKRFELSLDLSEIVDLSEKNSEEEDIENKTNDDELEGKEGDESSEDVSDKFVEDNEVADSGDEGITSDVEDKIGDDIPSDAMVIPVKSIVEVVTTIKDHNGNIIDQSSETIASSQEIKSVAEYAEITSNKLISMMKLEIADLKKSIAELRGEKDLANDNEILDNKSHLEDSDEAGQFKSSNDDDLVELDESLIKSPGDDDEKTNSELIEIDDSFLADAQSDAKTAVNDVLVKRLRDSLREALKGASGRID